jgi:hypothetical protein
MALNAAFLIGPLLPLNGRDVLAGPQAAQIETLALYSIRLHGAGFDIALVRFGIHLAITGVLIFRSTFLPRLIGAALAVAGICYAVNGLATFLSPPLASQVFPWILPPGFLAEGALTLWLLAVRLNVERWRSQRPTA